jgi:enoyl-CoA hydratase
MDYKNIILDIQDNIAIITFNRPKALNALNAELLSEFAGAVAAVEKNEDIKVLILTGAGDKAFVAGADINELSTFNPLQAKVFSKMGHDAISSLQNLPIPVIAAVNGFALGGGLEMALACDFIYAADNAKFGLPEIKLGIIPGFGGTQRLPRIIGKNLAKELIFTGRMIDAQQAAEMELVNNICPADVLMDEVRKTALEISKKGKVALMAAKQAINYGMDVDLANGCDIEINSFCLCLASPDAREGTTAFLEKRKPNFTGSRTG